MGSHTFTLSLSHPNETGHRAAQLAAHLTDGDTVLLAGEVGAGKTHFARALIKSLLDTPEDVPSPTFTLVQTYETAKGTIWHSDLYRITSTSEIEELGLSEAFEGAICLIEWPDRLADLTPSNALLLTLAQSTEENARRMIATWDAPKWSDKLAPWQT